MLFRLIVTRVAKFRALDAYSEETEIEYWKKSLAGIIDKSAEFDSETCPFCNCTLNLQNHSLKSISDANYLWVSIVHLSIMCGK